MISLPTTVPAYIESQERQIGRKLNDTEREMADMTVWFFNQAYEDGKAQVKTSMYPGMAVESAKEFLSMYPDAGDAAVRWWLRLCSACDEAWEMGAQS